MSYSIQKSMITETAHRLKGHPGKCRHIHGHSYKWEVSIAADEVSVDDDDKGMVLDFAVLKTAMKIIIEKYDHVLVLEDTDPIFDGTDVAGCVCVMRVPFPPTAENMSKRAFDQLNTYMKKLGVNAQVEYVRLWETANSSAMYNGNKGENCGTET